MIDATNVQRVALWLAVAFAALLAAPAVAAPKASDLVRSELLAETASVAPGESVRVGIRLQMAPHWHTYWRNPGDSGLATEIAWSLPAGFTAGPVIWPAPARIPVSHLVNYGYDGETLLMTEIAVPANAAPGRSVEIVANLSYLVCERECIPGEARLSLRLPLAAASPRPGPAAALFEEARRRVPLPAPWPTRASLTGDTVTLRAEAIGLPTIRDAYFFPYDETAITHAAPQVLAAGPDGLSLTLERSALAAGPIPADLGGVLFVEEAADGGTVTRAYAVGRETLPAAAGAAEGMAAPVPKAVQAVSLEDALQAALLAFLGGLILNLMPCVFPVLSIKIMSLVRHAGHPPRIVRLHGLAYTTGVVASFLGLAAILIAARAGGEEIGWGFQLQSPVVVAGLAFLLLAVGLGLSGAVEIGMGLASLGGRVSAAGGLSGSFLTGILASVVAAPCTAPFMGAAVGLALTAPAATALLIFGALGLGLATPFLALTLVPALAARLPRPGAWMEVLKQALAFPVYATVAWLVFVLSQQVGPTGLFAALIGLVAVGLGIWCLRMAQFAEGWARRVAQAGALAALVAVLALGIAVGRDPAGPNHVAAASGTEPFTQARLDALRAEGRPVFVNMTAAWCITCLVNERTSLSSEPVRQAMSAGRVAYLKGDWTNQNAEITRVLEQHGRSGVPLYLLYPPRGEAVVLPQILTQAIVVDTIARIGESAGKRADLTSSHLE